MVDFVAVIFEVGSLQQITCQDGRRITKRTATLIDDSHKMVSVGLWPDFTETLNGREGTAALFQNIQVREYMGRITLSTTSNSVINPDSAQAVVGELNRWFETEGCAHAYEELVCNVNADGEP